jgi:nicotinic acid mononucleotide adenylyltransferase
MKPAKHNPALQTETGKMLKLAHGLLMTLRNLHSRDSQDCTSTSRILAIQRFFREFDHWIKEMERNEISNTGIRAKLRRQRRCRSHSNQAFFQNRMKP